MLTDKIVFTDKVIDLVAILTSYIPQLSGKMVKGLKQLVYEGIYIEYVELTEDQRKNSG